MICLWTVATQYSSAECNYVTGNAIMNYLRATPGFILCVLLCRTWNVSQWYAYEWVLLMACHANVLLFCSPQDSSWTHKA
jgi:hypothetical protein